MDRMLHYLSALREYARDYVLENTGLKVLALLITAVLWLSVASRPAGLVTLHNVPIEIRYLPAELIVSKYDTLTARVFLRGPRDVLDTLRSGELPVFADMSGVEPGVRVRPLKLDRTRLPASVEAQVIEPGSIRVTVERLEQREVPVRPRFEGLPPEGYEVVSMQIRPSMVRVVGASSYVKDINEVLTETVSLYGRTETFSEQVAIDTGSPDVNLKDEAHRNVMLTVSISEVRKERVLDHVPVTLVGAPPTAQPVPQFIKVTLFGPRSAVEAITVADVVASVDYQAEPNRPRDFTPKINLSPQYSDRVVVWSFEPGTVRVR